MSTYFFRGLVASITFIVCTLLIGNAAISLKEPAAITAMFPLIGVSLIIIYSNLHEEVTVREFLYRTLFSGIVAIISFLIICKVSIALNVPEILWATLLPTLFSFFLMFSSNEK